MFVNVKGRVIEVTGKFDKEGAVLGIGNKLYGTNQRFSLTYSDKEKNIETSGLNSDFGFSIGRPFYIVTKMGSGRAIEVVGGRNLVLRWKKPNSEAQ